MGNLFSKKNTAKVQPEPYPPKPASAPARLTGGGIEALDVPLPERRAITPPADIGRFDDTPSTPTPLSPSTPQGGKKKIDVLGAQTDGTQLAAALPASTALPDTAKHWAEVFPEHVVRGLHGSDWKDREQAITSMTRMLQTPKFVGYHDPQRVYNIVCEALSVSLKDKVAPIYHASLELVGVLMGAFSDKVSLQVLHAGADSFVPTIVHRCGNLNTRIHESSMQALLGMALRPSFGPAYLAPHVLAPLPKRAAAQQQSASGLAQMSGRLALLLELLAAHPGADVTLGSEQVLGLVKSALEMPDEKVRQQAVRSVAELFRLRALRAQRSLGRGGGGSGKGGMIVVASGAVNLEGVQASFTAEMEKVLGAIKPALMQVFQQRFADVAQDIREGGSGAAAAAGGASTVASGPGNIRAAGKILPPIAKGRGGMLPAIGSGAAGASSPAAPAAADLAVVGTAPRTPASPAAAGSPSSSSPAAAARARRAGGPRSRMPADGASSSNAASTSGLSASDMPLSSLPRTGSSRKGAPAAAAPASQQGEASSSGAPRPSSKNSTPKPRPSSLSPVPEASPTAAAAAAARGIVLDEDDEQLINYIVGKGAGAL